MTAANNRLHKSLRKARPSIERLENRSLMAADLQAVLAAGRLDIRGTDAADQIEVRQIGETVEVVGVGAFAIGDVNLIRVFAEGGDDTVRLSGLASIPSIVWGGSGNDTLIGGDGPDRLSGQDGNDVLRGGAGDDRLFGGFGNDDLAGGDGDDALSGSRGKDRLAGNAGSDRFLSQGDTVADGGTQDALLSFADGDRTWKYKELLAVDQVLETLQDRVGNTKLLKLASGGGLTFERAGVVQANDHYFGENDSQGTIRLADSLFEQTGDWLSRTVIHEIAHNWDDPSENPFIAQFRQQSGWKYGDAVMVGEGVASGDGKWSHDTEAVFARGYGRVNPFEDFATSVEVAFGTASQQDIAGKLDVIDGWLDWVAGKEQAPPASDQAVAEIVPQSHDADPMGIGVRAIASVVTMRNGTANPVSYYINWTGTWQLYRLNPGQARLHFTGGQNRRAWISFDRSFSAGYQEASWRLSSKPLVTGAVDGEYVDRANEGFLYNFFVNGARTGLNLQMDGRMETTRFSGDRAELQRQFPRLGNDFEILADETAGNHIIKGNYNCIAWSVGQVNQWEWSTFFQYAPNLAGADNFYRQYGFQRMSSYDTRLDSRYQKVVVYAKINAYGVRELTHAALQLGDGTWTSKLGGLNLIRHRNPWSVSNGDYGVPVAVYARPV